MIGQLRDRVTILQPHREPDAAGGAAITFPPSATIWARLEPRPSGRDRLAHRDAGLFRHRMTVRTRTDITHETRFRIAARDFRILSLAQQRDDDPYQTIDIEEVRG